MSMGGDGVITERPWVEGARHASENLPFIPRRFQVGGRLQIADSPAVRTTISPSCVLCGGIIANEDATLEHPLPQWLHRMAGNVSENRVEIFSSDEQKQPTWRQLCLASHKKCNTEFARKIEEPVISPINRLTAGGRVTWSEIDAIFDWLDKIKSSSALMGAALGGHSLQLNYYETSFPNLRIGAFDRIGIFFRVTDKIIYLDLLDFLNYSFLSTPSAMLLRIKDLMIVYVSNNFLLSSTFGLAVGTADGGFTRYVPGTGLFVAGLGARRSRLPAAKIIAQPMRRQHRKQGLSDVGPALQPNGDGRVFELCGSRWHRVRSTDFSSLVRINSSIGYALAGLEVIEWLILCKEQDFARYGKSEAFFMKSLPDLHEQKLGLLDTIAELRGGIRPSTSDRL
ncbi:MAG: hypothetical protein H2050_04145 [Sphingobium sp.]|uniref:hypothetical protein n=1 Tax=Sphingobium sp. TaxID=1912891 RepID=UPI0017EAC645|nr:hypothetical protein [Sphingobium sp.]MBU0657983.1 hypothetical protein [Alphaproteobacteria bacterium]MBA4754008.1 hypothetical protein [Sphingobium sp.]MBU0775533.1 hypothetical protein [Alphaproteobacteria bacterium]MBU0867891.1 hypothetical protein [Alphaproteobacteria bacterium]MBU1793974.1 hypothetical protein [Alphaproteobacteria bacterium]